MAALLVPFLGGVSMLAGGMIVDAVKLKKDKTKAGEVFGIVKGVYDAFKLAATTFGLDKALGLKEKDPCLKEDPTIKMLKELEVTIKMLKEVTQEIRELTARTEMFNHGLGQEVRVGSAYQQILNHMRDYMDNPNDRKLIETICDRTDGIHHQLLTLQDGMTTPSAVNHDGPSWIKYICKRCQDNADRDDLTWGFKDAIEIVGAMLAFQRSAIEIWEKAMHVEEPDNTDISRMVRQHHKEVDKQVDEFWTIFAEYWNNTVGEVKECHHKHSVLHNGEWYYIEKSSHRRTYTTSVRKRVRKSLRARRRSRKPQYRSRKERHTETVDKYKLMKKCSDTDTSSTEIIPDIKRYCGSTGGLASLGRYLWHIDSYNYLVQVNPKSGREHRTLHFPTHCYGLLSHQGYLYTICKGDLYKIDTQDESKICLGRGGWSSDSIPKLAAVPDNSCLYINDLEIYKIDPSKVDTSGYTTLDIGGLCTLTVAG